MSQSLELLFRIQTQGRQELENVVKALRGASVEVRAGAGSFQQLDAAAGKATIKLQQMERALAPVQEGLTTSFLKANLLAGSIERVTSFVREYTVEAAKYAARTQTLSVVMDHLAEVNRLSVGATRAQADEVRRLGITTQESMATINKMIFAQLDLRHATDLARLAQNAAVIAGVNSSQALGGIVHGITTRQTEVLRTYGIIVDFEAAYTKAARERGRALTEVEKSQVALNEVMKQGGKIMGTYEVSMLTAGKQLTSLSRYVDEAKNAIGDSFVPALGNAVRLMADLAKYAQQNGEQFAKMAVGVTTSATALAVLWRTPLPIQAKLGLTALAGATGYIWGGGDPIEFAREQGADAIANVRTQQRAINERLGQTGLSKANAELLKAQYESLKEAETKIVRQVADTVAQVLLERTKGSKGPRAEWLTIMDERLREGLDLGGGVRVRTTDIVPAIHSRRNPQVGATFDQASYDKAVEEELAARAKEEAKKLAEKTLQRLVERNQQMTRLVDSLDKGGLDPLARLILDMRQNLRDLTQRYGNFTGAEAAEIQRRFSGRLVRELEGERRKAPLETIPFEQPGALAFWASRPAVAQSVQADPAASEAVLQRFRDRSLAASQRELQYRERMIALLAGPGGERAAIEQIAKVREEAALREFQITKDRHALEDRLDQNRKDRIIAIFELQKRQLEQYRETAGRVFDALTARGGSGGLRDFVAGQVKILERQIFVNASAGIFRQAGGMLGRVGAASGLGGLLAGTIFDPQNANPAEATIDNTRETRLNTDELRRLRITFQGGTTGTLPAAGLSLLESFRAGPTADETLRMLGGVLGTEAAGSPGLARRLQDAIQGSTPARGAQNLLAGLVSPLTAGLFAGVRGGDYSIALGGGRATTASALGLTSTAGRIGNLVGSGALVGLGTLGVLSGIREGGARGATTAVASGLGIASAIPGPQQPIVQAVALVAGLVRGMFGDPKDQRRRSLERDLEGRRFTEPEGTEYATDIYGREVDRDFRGRLRALPPQINVTINAMDASTFRDFARSNPVAFSEAVTAAIQSGNGEDLVGTLRQTLT